MKAQHEDRFLRGRQIAYLIYEYFRVTGANDSVENYADLFTIALRNDDIQEFGSKWDGILLSMTKSPPDDILEGLYKLRIRESEKIKTELEVYNMEIHQRKAGPDNHRLKTMVKRSREQNLRMKNFEARNGKYETKAVVKNQGTKQREQRSLENVGNGKLTECVLKETIAVSGTIREPEVRETEAQVEECPDCRARITSKELAPLHSVKSGILQNACSTSPRMDADLEKSALMRIARLMNSLAKGPKRMVTKVQWLCCKVHDNWFAYFRIWSRRSLHRFCGRAQTYGSQSDVFDSLKPSYVMLTFETRIHCLE